MGYAIVSRLMRAIGPCGVVDVRRSSEMSIKLERQGTILYDSAVDFFFQKKGNLFKRAL